MASKNLIVRGGADFSGLKREMEKTQKTISNFQGSISKTFAKIGGVLAGAFAVKKLYDYGKASVQTFNSVGVEAAKLGQVMRNTMGATEAQIQSIKKLTQAQEGIGVVAWDTQMAGAQELGTYLSNVESLKTLIPTLNDMLAQQYGVDATNEQAVTIGTMIGKVMDGQLGALSRYGYSWDEAQEKVLKFGSELERASMLAEVIGQSVGGINAELAKTPAGMLKQVQFTFAAIKETIGKGLSPVIATLLPYVQKLANYLLRAAQAFSALMRALFGKSPQKQMAGTTQAQTAAIDDQSSAVGGLGKSYKKAGKEAKKAQGFLAGFDEVNTINKSSDSGSGDGSGGDGGVGDVGGGGIGISALDMPDLDTETIPAKIQAMADKIRGILSTIKDGFNFLKDAIVENKNIILPALGAIAGALLGLAVYQAITGIISFFKTLQTTMTVLFTVISANPVMLLVMAIGALIGGLVTAYMTNDKFREKVDNLFKTIKTALAPVFEKLGEIAKQVWNSVLVPMGNFLKTAFVAALEAVTKAGKWLWENILVPFGEFLKWLWKTVLEPIAKVLSDVLAIAFKTVTEVAKILWKNVLVPLGDFIKAVFLKIVESLGEIFKHLWDKVLTPFGNYLKATFKPVVEGISEVFMYLWNTVLKPLATFLAGTFVKVFETASLSVKTIIGGLKNIFTGLLDFITGVFTGNWRKAWEGVKSIFKGVFDSLWGIVKYPLNLVIAGINAVISGLNSINIKIPDWVPGFGGMNFGITIPKIPALAKGGITNGPMLAMIGDNPGGQEVVSPLDDLLGMMTSTVGKAVSAAMQSDNQQGGDVVIMFDGVELGRAAAKGINKAQRSSGKLLLDI